MLSGKPFFIVIPFIFVLASCGGGSSGDDTDTTAPTVSSVTPVDGASDVARDSVITATFGEDLFATTVDGTSFTLSGNSAAAGVVTFDGSTNVASFTPDSELDLLTAYTATLTTDITDLSGNALASNYSWSFTSADGAWGTEAALIEIDNADDASGPQIAFDGSGNAIAVWYQYDGTRYNIWANRYVAGTGWNNTAAEMIEIDDLGNAFSPQIAFDGSGNAIAVWHQYDGNRYNIWANRYVAGTDWDDTAAEMIEIDAGGASSPQIAFDGSGNAMAVWYQHDGTHDSIWANRYVAGTGWDDTAAEMIENDNVGNAEYPQIAVDGSGNTMAVWHQYDGTRFNIWANRYVAGTGWDNTAAEMIENDDAGDASYPQIAFDGSGNAIAVWDQYDGTRHNIWANRYVAGTGWNNTAAEMIENTNEGNAFSPQIAFDGSGNAIAV
ncbi:MAG: Ig-like domain-containing protein, partial [Chloroflexi bacterium]|nr:Ig-like domain-containing protein [Chloroflexota bacterium]